MSENVHILATCSKPELIDATLLVFKTLRVGFPKANVTVWRNGEPTGRPAIDDAAMKVDCELVQSEPTIHHDWIKERLRDATEPFWICDTDMVFWKSVEDWKVQAPLAGAYIPEFFDSWSRCRTAPRLHTSLLRFDPVLIKARLETLHDKVRVSRFTPLVDLVAPVVLPNGFFYDTCSLLYHAVGGQQFNEAQLEAYEHLHGGTWIDELSQAYPGLKEVHQSVYADISKAKGSHVRMQQFYQFRGSTLDEFCHEVCVGQPDAMAFCHLWFNYCHAIDDLVDVEDRPNSEMLLEVFALANAVFSTPFYQKHLSVLQPIVLMVTNAYADSVKWEHSTVPRRKTISDVLRCCGNEMFFTVAMICGGWKHERSVSSKIRDRSWQLQHDAADKPI